MARSMAGVGIVTVSLRKSIAFLIIAVSNFLDFSKATLPIGWLDGAA